VAYRLTKQMVSTKAVKRSNRFHVDPAVDGCPSPDEYKRSGYDRGHIAAAEDMRWSEQAMQDSFSMANMTPQSPGLNRGPWKRLEERVRTWAAAFDEVYVTAGPVLTEPCLKTIGHAICVPARHFKVVLERTGGEIKAIGFIFPQDAKGDLTPYVRSVAEVQKVTGLDFFPALPDDIEQKVEAHADLGAWVPLERGLAGSGVSP
jgi:endonuclease G